MGYLKSWATSFVYVTFFLAVITFLPGLPPIADFTEYSIQSPAELSGVLAQNDRLNDAEILFENELNGAESFDSYNGELYTGMHGGYVGKIVGKKIVPIVKFGKDCGGVWEQEKCGRPLGMKFDDRGLLYVADTYYGIFKVNVATGKYEKIVDPGRTIDGKAPKFINSVDVAKNGDLYWTDSTTEFLLYDGVYAMLADPAGRLIRYNAATKKNEVLLKNIGFANGVKLSDDESYVIVAETMKSTIVKYHLKGSKAGKSEILIGGLPGTPDNIHTDGLGNYLVSMVVPADPEHPIFAQTIVPHPNIRKMIARLLGIIELPFKLLNDVYPNDIAKRAMHAIGSFESLSFTYKQQVTILRFDGNGRILDVLHNSDEKIAGVSSAFVHDDYLWLGSPYNEYIARVPLKKAFPNQNFPSTVKKQSGGVTRETIKVTEAPKKLDEPVVTRSKPEATTTTTTPKPRATTTTTTTKPTTTATPTTQPPKIPKPAKVEQVKQVPKAAREDENRQKRSAEIPKKVVDTGNKQTRKNVESVKIETDELPKPIKMAETTKTSQQASKPAKASKKSEEPAVKTQKKKEPIKRNAKLPDEM